MGREDISKGVKSAGRNGKEGRESWEGMKETERMTQNTEEESNFS